MLSLWNHYSNLSYYIAGVDFIGPTPSTLIFMAGQSMGDIQCADVTIPDDSIPQPQRTFNVSIGDNVGTVSDGGDGGGGGGGNGGGGGGDGGRGGSDGGGVRISSGSSSISVDIEVDINDRK